MNVTLPQNSTEAGPRAERLSEQQARWGYQEADGNPMAPIAVTGRAPLKLGVYKAAWIFKYLGRLIRALLAWLWASVKVRWYLLWNRDDPFGQYARMFSFLAPPPTELIEDFTTDGRMGLERVAGPNPLLITRVRSVSELTALMPVVEPALQQALGDPAATIAGLLDSSRLFVCDYRLLQASLIPPAERDSRWRGKYLPAPVMLLVDDPNPKQLCDLVPLAIRWDQPGTGAANPVIWRGEGPAWQLARTYVQVADANLQNLSSHLHRHHWMIEPFALTTRRRLSDLHPLYILLEPHVAWVMHPNAAAARFLDSPGSVFDTIYSGTLDETRNIARVSHAEFPWDRCHMEADFQARGVTDAPREYPYRDDLRLWATVLTEYVSEYLGLWYLSDDDVKQDRELALWAAELCSPQGGNLIGFPHSFDTRQALTREVVQILLLAGPSHAAVHYPQLKYFSFVPAFPGAAYAAPPNQASQAAPRLESVDPPTGPALTQFRNNQIADFKFDRFGDFGRYRLGRLRLAVPVVAALREALQELEREINARNGKRREPYPYLLPSEVPNGISI